MANERRWLMKARLTKVRECLGWFTLTLVGIIVVVVVVVVAAVAAANHVKKSGTHKWYAAM